MSPVAPPRDRNSASSLDLSGAVRAESSEHGIWRRRFRVGFSLPLLHLVPGSSLVRPCIRLTIRAERCVRSVEQLSAYYLGTPIGETLPHGLQCKPPLGILYPLLWSTLLKQYGVSKAIWYYRTFRSVVGGTHIITTGWQLSVTVNRSFPITVISLTAQIRTAE